MEDIKNKLEEMKEQIEKAEIKNKQYIEFKGRIKTMDFNNIYFEVCEIKELLEYILKWDIQNTSMVEVKLILLLRLVQLFENVKNTINKEDF